MVCSEPFEEHCIGQVWKLIRKTTEGQRCTNDIISSAACKFCELDPASTWIIKKYASELSPFIVKLFNTSLTSGLFPTSQKCVCHSSSQEGDTGSVRFGQLPADFQYDWLIDTSTGNIQSINFCESQILEVSEDFGIPTAVLGLDVDSGSSQVVDSVSSQLSASGSQIERKRFNKFSADDLKIKRQKLMINHNYWSTRSPRFWMRKYRKCADNYVKLNKN